MHYRTYRTPAVVAAMLTAFGLVAPAQADTTTTQTTTTEVTTLGAPATVVTPAGVTTTTTVGTVPVTGTAGGTVYFRTAKPEVLLLTITARRKDLDKMIDSAHAKGKITEKEARAMKAELKRIERETGSNTITYERAVAFARDLDFIGTRLGGVVVEGVPVYQPIIAGSHFTVVNGQIYVLDDLSVRRVDLEARIIKDYLEGRLSDDRASKLRAELDAIGTTQAIYSASGELDPVSSRKFYKEMDKVASELERYAGKDNN
ncbi:MAG TPA: hypothetical protein V6C89_16330 [Drouetiella sp.]|jgi:hypothetical protein